MQISSNIVKGPKSNNLVLMGIWVIICVQKTSHRFLQIIRPLRMFKIVFRDSSLYPKQLSLVCLLRLISASADRIGRAYARGGWDYSSPPLELDILQKLYCLCKGD